MDCKGEVIVALRLSGSFPTAKCLKPFSAASLSTPAFEKIHGRRGRESSRSVHRAISPPASIPHAENKCVSPKFSLDLHRLFCHGRPPLRETSKTDI
jgi:hypothetical protein